MICEPCLLRHPQPGAIHCRKTPSCHIPSHADTDAATQYSLVEVNALPRYHKNLRKMWSPRTTLQTCLILKHLDSAYGCTINRMHKIGKAYPLRRFHPAQASSQWLCIYNQPYVCELEGLTIGTFSAMIVLMRMLSTVDTHPEGFIH
jgi:hypothetical protein